jgi:imidazolonepropionase-like amidohydrolase
MRNAGSPPILAIHANRLIELLSLEEMKAIVEEAHKSGRRVAAHAVDDASARIAADAGVDSIEHAYGV